MRKWLNYSPCRLYIVIIMAIHGRIIGRTLRDLAGTLLDYPPFARRLATNPLATGSLSCAITMGIVIVASLAARVGIGPAVTMTATSRRTSSAASARRRSGFRSANRHSMIMFFPSMYPSSWRPWRNGGMRAELGEEEPI